MFIDDIDARLRDRVNDLLGHRNPLFMFVDYAGEVVRVAMCADVHGWRVYVPQEDTGARRKKHPRLSRTNDEIVFDFVVTHMCDSDADISSVMVITPVQRRLWFSAITASSYLVAVPECLLYAHRNEPGRVTLPQKRSRPEPARGESAHVRAQQMFSAMTSALPAFEQRHSIQRHLQAIEHAFVAVGMAEEAPPPDEFWCRDIALEVRGRMGVVLEGLAHQSA